MKTKHLFVAAVDVGEIIPFTIKKSKDIQDNIKKSEEARAELKIFIDKLEKNFSEELYYLGFDEIAGKFYERFMFKRGGFLEIMMEAPVVINSHFISKRRAEKFCLALKKTLASILPENKISEMFINSIEVGTQNDESLTYKKWELMKELNR